MCNYDSGSGTGTIESEDIVSSVIKLENKETEKKLVGDETARKPRQGIKCACFTIIISE